MDTFRNGYIFGFATATVIGIIAIGYIFPSTQLANFVHYQTK
jgi:hypothetical protein